MATYTEIATRVAQLVIDVTTEAAAQIQTEIQEAQRELEDAHGFLVMEELYEFATVQGNRGPYEMPPSVVRARTDVRPILADGTGMTQQIDWLITENDATILYGDDPIDEGRPRNVREKLVYENDTEKTQIFVYPFPDALAPAGAVYADPNWRIRVPHFKRQPTLGAGPGLAARNWFSDHARRYLEYRAAARVQAFNRDWEEASGNAALAEGQKRILINHDKKRRLSRERLFRPNRGARGSAFQFRGLR